MTHLLKSEISPNRGETGLRHTNVRNATLNLIDVKEHQKKI